MPSPPRWRPCAAAARSAAGAAAPAAGRPAPAPRSGVLRVLVMPVWTPFMPVPVGPGALAAGDGLVVHPAVAADEDVVHRPLGRGRDLVGHDLGQRPEADVGDALADLDVARPDGHRGPGGDQRARRGRSR